MVTSNREGEEEDTSGSDGLEASKDEADIGDDDGDQ